MLRHRHSTEQAEKGRAVDADIGGRPCYNLRRTDVAVTVWEDHSHPSYYNKVCIIYILQIMFTINFKTLNHLKNTSRYARIAQRSVRSVLCAGATEPRRRAEQARVCVTRVCAAAYVPALLCVDLRRLHLSIRLALGSSTCLLSMTRDLRPLIRWRHTWSRNVVGIIIVSHRFRLFKHLGSMNFVSTPFLSLSK